MSCMYRIEKRRHSSNRQSPDPSAEVKLVNRFIRNVMLAAGALGLAGAVQASSFQFANVGDNVTVLYSWAYTDSSNSTPVQLSAEITYTLTSLVDNNTATFGVQIENTTPSSTTGVNRISAFGVDIVTPSLTGASTTSNVFDDTLLNTNTPSGIGRVDFCATAGPRCTGGGGGGLLEGGLDAFTLTLDFSAAVPPITFKNFVIRYQGVGINDSGSIAFTGCVRGDPNCDPQQVPEPGSLALVGLALLGAYSARRRVKA